MELFFEAGVYKGIAVLKYLASVNHTVPPVSKSKFLWDEDRRHYGQFYNTDLILLHPVKPSSLSIARNRKK
ncbi:unnamed protein product [Cylicocyclus nassatus]|uniref:Uncharacterized protein n=1 Tax=Cylicocyclus nassatus TaxID=53992 RepID=A0AA36GRF7_CYLNA|nr:unnamed protein product [Cylicocyclus nassatus]